MADEQVTERACTKCGEVKPLEEYHRNPMGKYGRLPRCKQCANADQKRYRQQPEVKKKIQDRHREYYQRPDVKKRKHEYRKKYRGRSDVQKKIYEYTARQRKQHPNRVRIYGEVDRAIKTGLLIRPDKCESCNASGNIVAHHENYDFPLVVIWLCRRCHYLVHQKEGA